MRLTFDMDGTICDGRYLAQPINPSDYLALAPYDSDTVEIWNQLMAQYPDSLIITARSYGAAVDDVYQWLDDHAMKMPAGVLTGISTAIRPTLIEALRPHYRRAEGPDSYHEVWHFDDHPQVFQNCPTCHLMDNPAWPDNQALRYAANPICSWRELYARINN